MKIIFVDTETTGLDPERHEPFEVALIDWASGEEHVFRFSVALDDADPGALRINRFYERHPALRVTHYSDDAAEPEEAREIAALTSNAVLAGNVVSFDALMLAKLLKRFGLAPAWHYHYLDVEVFAAGALGLEPPWDSKAISERLEIAVPEGSEAHTALADARWAREMYLAALALKKGKRT